MQAHGRNSLGRLGQEAGQLVDAKGRHGARRGKLAAQLFEIGVLAADARPGPRPAPAVRPAYWAPKNMSKKPGQVSAVIRIRSPGAKPAPIRRRAPTCGALPDLAPRQGRDNLAADTIKSDAGLAPGRVVQHLGHRAERRRDARRAGNCGWAADHGRRVSYINSTPPPGGEASDVVPLSGLSPSGGEELAGRCGQTHGPR